jgi:tetratricopeptide (TPR) repeat protein
MDSEWLKQRLEIPGSARDVIQIGQLRELILQLSGGSLPAPMITDLFEIIRNPSDIQAAIFRTDPGPGLVPYEVPYVPEREGSADVQTALYEALLDSGGALLVQSRAGLGKTREVVQLATRLCDEEGWTVCVAKETGDAQLAAPASFADGLRGSRLLFIFDDLHRRVGSGVSGQAAYTERLDAFLAFFDRQLAPGEKFILATTRTEPHHQRQLAFDPQHPLWRRFGVYELPEFTLVGLQTILLGLAQQVGVVVEPAEMARMVANSDRTIRTLVKNINLAKRHQWQLSLSRWLPTGGGAWEASFRLVRGHYPAAGRVYEALHLIREAGLPTRFPYVVALGTRLGGANIAAAAEELVGIGLLGLRGGHLDAFGDEQLQDSLHATGQDLPEVNTCWEAIIESVMTEVDMHVDWSHDLVTLTYSLMKAQRDRDCEFIATAAIAQRQNDFLGYFSRGVARIRRGNYTGAKADFTAAIARGQDDAVIYRLRGLARYVQDDATGAEADFTAAIARGQDDAAIYFDRGAARTRQGHFAGAEADFTAAIARGRDNASVYYYRGAARTRQGHFAGAEADFTAAIARDPDQVNAYYWRGKARYMQNDIAGAEADFTAAIARDPEGSRAYYWQGIARHTEGDYVGAEADFTIAIARDPDDAKAYYWRGRARYGQDHDAAAEADFTAAIARGRDDSEVYEYRGLARYFQENYAGAEADFTAVIARDPDQGKGYYWRGRARYWQDIERGAEGDYVGAEADFTIAIARNPDDAEAYYWRGSARSMQGHDAAAEGDFTAAIACGENNAKPYDYQAMAKYYYDRGVARYMQDNDAAAEVDFTAAIARGRDDVYVYYYRGSARYFQKNYSGAEADFTIAIARDPDDAEAYYWRGVARYIRDDPAGADADLTAAIALGRDDADVYYWRGRAGSMQGNAAAAEADFSAAIARGRDDADVHQQRAFVYVRLGRLAEAQNDCEQAERLAPNDPFTHGRWGDLNLALGKYEDAIARYQSALDAESNAGWHFELGMALLLAGRFEGARAAYDTGSRKGSRSNITAALHELNFWTLQRADHPKLAGLQEAISNIQQQLESNLLSQQPCADPRLSCP